MNLYAAPKSPLDLPTSGRTSTAILIGAAIGTGASYAILTVFGIIFLWVLTLQGVSPQNSYVMAYQSTPYMVFASAVAFMCYIPGGYWSARLSQSNPLVTALLAGAIVGAFSAITNLMPYELPIPTWCRIAGMVVPLPSFALGAVLWRRVAAR